MSSPLPCRSGKARPCAAFACRLPSSAASLLLILAGLLSSALAAPAAPKTGHFPLPAPPFHLAPVAASKAVMPVQTLLVRDDLTAMGANNAVRLWVRGDGSGADLRVRVLSPRRTSGASTEPMPRDAWISEPLPITFVGWREWVLPRSKFTLRSAPPMPATLDLALPADAQAPVEETPPVAPAAAASAVSPAVTPAASSTAPPPANPAATPMTVPDWSAANSVALDVTASRQTMLVVDDLSWATLDDSGKQTAGTVATDFETGNVGAWKPVGTKEETSAVVYGITTQAGQVHGGRVAFRLTVTPPALQRQTTLKLIQTVMSVSNKPYLVWTPDSLFMPVLPSTLPSAGGGQTQLTLQACPEQTQAATFCLYSPVALTAVSLSMPQDLQGIGHTIPSSAVDLHVVKVWPQGGAGLLRDPDSAGLVPELLVKDDRVALSGTAPAIRLTGPAVCDIPADTSKQFWITVSVPRNTPSNNYIGKLIVTGRGIQPFSVRLVVSVLPLRLLSPAKQYGIALRSRLDLPPAHLPSPDGKALVTDFVSKQTLDSQLADIYAHGITIATLCDSPSTLWDAVSEYKAYGLGTPYNLYRGEGNPQDLEKLRLDNHSPALTYYTAPEPTASAQARMAPLTKAGIPNVTYIPHQTDYDALQANADIVVYNRDSEYPQQLLRTKGQRVSTTRDWWYWPATNESPNTNRVDMGYLLWRANLYGAFLPDYQTAFGADPYDEAAGGAPASQAAFRPMMLTYPVKDGVLDTLQWEACREGISDVRYLTTLYAALRECKDAHIAAPLITEVETYVKTFLEKPLANLPGGEYDKFRAQAANYAMQLRSAVDAYNKAHAIQ